MVPKTKWTILTYIAAHNDLQFFGKRSYDEIIAVGSTPEVVHGVLFDWPDGAARYIVGSPGHVQRQEQLGNYDAGFFPAIPGPSQDGFSSRSSWPPGSSAITISAATRHGTER